MTLPQRRTAALAAVPIALLGSSLAGCIGAPTQAATPVGPMPPEETRPPVTESLADRFSFPARVDPTERYLIYLHGKILEDQGLPAVSPEFGEYQYDGILEALGGYGFHVVSEQRPRDADGWEYARRTSQQVGELLAAGVPAGSITVVGASKGASIAVGASYLVGNPDVNYVLLGSCHPSLIDGWRQQGVTLSGNVLAIYDIADNEYSGSCADLFARSKGLGLSRNDELVLHVGTGHGILYQPFPEWVVPTVRWAKQEW